MRKIDPRSSHAKAEEQYLRNTTWSIAWKAKAIELNRAFEQLSRVVLSDVDRLMAGDDCIEPSLTATTLMIGGLVVENLLKGLIARRKGVPSTKGLPRFTDHKLVDLAREADVSLSYSEQVLLQRLTEFVLWSGRYPAPQRVEAMRGYTNEDGGFGSLVTMCPPKDLGDTATMIARLFLELD